MLKAAEFESVIPDLMSDVFVSSPRPKITTITLFPCMYLFMQICRSCIRKKKYIQVGIFYFENSSNMPKNLAKKDENPF